MEKIKNQSTEYWQSRAVRHLKEMRADKLAGLFPKSEGWRNVVEHELVEAEAVDVLAEALDLPQAVREDLYSAALLHDVYKRKEREAFKERGSVGAEETDQKQSQFIKSLGFKEEIAYLSALAGGYALPHYLENPTAEALTLKKNLPLAELVMHYVDDITLGSDLVSLKERIDYVKERYKDEDKSGRKMFGGSLPSDVQFEVSRQIEIKLAGLIGIGDPETLSEWIKSKILERIELNILEKVAVNAAFEAYRVYESLGEAGKEKAGVNQFGEQRVRGDWECEEAVIDTFKQAGINARVVSEEHGTFEIGENSEYLVTLDGIDGSRQYLSEPNEDRHFGPMVSIFKGLDPAYCDSLVSFMFDFSSGNLFLAVRGDGTYVIENGNKRRVVLKAVKKFEKDLVIYGDGESKYAPQLVGFPVVTTASSCSDYMNLLTGKAQAVNAYTLKQNLELACAYRLVTEAGGAMIKIDDGEDLGEEKYLDFGQKNHRGVVSVASLELAKEIYNLGKR